MENNEKVGAIRRCWRSLRQPSTKYSFIGIATVFFFVGIIFWGAFNTALEATNRLGFCTSCHEMQENFKEYKNTVHYKNAFGVRAICSDCHVPRDWTHKLIRKAEASFEIWAKITGRVDTPAKWEANRMRLATKEWARMKANNSRECRNCHSYAAMDKDAQGETRYNKHMEAEKTGQTCIDCHKGIAHHLPKEFRDPDED